MAKRDGQPFVLLYCFEPSIMASPKHSPRHWRFISEALHDLMRRGYPVAVWWGEVTGAFDAINERFRIESVFSHQETSHRLSFLRDRAVRAWCRSHDVMWWEFVQEGVIRGRKHRRGWAQHNDDFLARPQVQSEGEVPGMVRPFELELRTAIPQNGCTKDFRQSEEEVAIHPAVPGLYDLPELPHDPNFQPGGETVAWRYLRSFTTDRGKGYAYQLGSPTLSRTSCSRMSTYLAYGCVSVKQVFQWAKRVSLEHPEWSYDLKMFRERLWWRGHYFQKLEAEWQLEFRPLNPALTNLHRTCDPAFLSAFKEARTGFPMIDANLRCLEATGWINFRSRAMLVTFATFVLWLDFRPIAEHLGRLFLDYDPGIHYGQFQMQAGLTGYHPPRNYNPYLQGEKYDADGEFVHKWLPELRDVPAPFCHYPHRLTALERGLYGLGELNYPAPIVDFDVAAKGNMDRYWAVRHSDEAQGELMGLWLKHVLPESREKYQLGVDPSPRRDV